MPTLVDTHVHLGDPAFDADRGDVIAAANAAGINWMIEIGYRPDTWDSTLALVAATTGLSCALGIHPGDAASATHTDLDRLAELASRPGVVAIGEIGLDAFWTTETLAVQEMWFRSQLDLAAQLGLPVVIHQRAAATGVHVILAERDLSLRVVLHSFDGDAALADLALERGYLIGVGGLMTRASSDGLRDTLRRIPLDQLVLETDAPYLVPTGVKSRRNSPALLPAIAARLATLLELDVDEIADGTTRNAMGQLIERPRCPVHGPAA